MTSFERFNQNEVCPHCGGSLAWRRMYPYPVLLQFVFAASFIGFIVLFDRISAHRLWLWLWTGAQAILGVFLIRSRLRTRKRILRCIRCNEALR
jgi:hypothetical protein